MLLKRLVVLVCLLAFLVPLTACENEGPMEKAGKKLDQAADDLKDKTKKMFE